MIVAHIALAVLGILVVAAACLPLTCSVFVVLAAFHRFASHLDRAAPVQPRTVVLVPAYNEAAVLGSTIEALMAQEYPPEALRVLVVDDASTDDTGSVLAAAAARHPGRVGRLHREVGGLGKAAVLNAGLAAVLADDWAEAVLIIDADVVFDPGSLRAMTRHLADPEVGAVGGYVREGSRPGTSVTRFVGIEYVTAQALARRSANVVGVAVCVPGGAQLHSRANLEALGGQIDTSTLAEDTVTTIETQLHGHRVVFEPHGSCWAEEPATLRDLWKQRLRWGRGNVQIMAKYRGKWFRPGTPVGRLGFGVPFFAVTLLPLVIPLASAALLILYFTDYGYAAQMLRVFWISNALFWVVTTVFSLAVDPMVARRSWRQAVAFPGLVSLVIIAYTLVPRLVDDLADRLLAPLGASVGPAVTHREALAASIWVGVSLAVAYLAKAVEAPDGPRRRLGAVMLYIAGYGPFLCAAGLASFLLEARGAPRRWDHTVKTGRMRGGPGDRAPAAPAEPAALGHAGAGPSAAAGAGAGAQPVVRGDGPGHRS